MSTTSKITPHIPLNVTLPEIQRCFRLLANQLQTTGSTSGSTAPSLSGLTFQSTGGSSSGFDTGSHNWTGLQNFKAAVVQVEDNANFQIVNTTDNSKVIEFDASGLSTATTRLFALPDASGQLAILSGINQTWGSTQDFTGASTKVATAAVDTNTTQAASTAFVLGQAATVSPLNIGVAAVGTSTRYARQDHVHNLPDIITPGGPIGDATHVAQLTYDSKGRLTAVSSVAIVYPGGITGFGNPTALVGLSVVNGSATTAMRSDGAPALDQSIAPTWTGYHTYSGGMSRKVVNKTANYTALTTDQVIQYNVLAGTRTVTMPAAAAAGQVLWIVDGSGSASPSVQIQVIAAAGGNINGTTAALTAVNVAYGSARLVCIGAPATWILYTARPVVGSVTSVAATVPAEITLSGSPITTSGTLAFSWTSQTQNLVFASPNGSTGTPSFRALVTADLPAGTGTVTSVALTTPAFLSVTGSPITTSGTFAVTLAGQSANLVFAGPSSGAAAAPTFRAIVAADLPGSFSGFANPSASVGLTAVNGIATTAMASDSAPALSQSISPTWSGNHTFSNPIQINAATSTLGNGATVGIMFIINGSVGNRGFKFQTAGSDRWLWYVANSTAESGSNAGSDFSLIARTDAGGALGTWLTMIRASGVTTFAGTTDATSSTSANLISSGGLAVAKKAYVGNELVGTGVAMSTVNKSANYTAVSTDYAIRCDASGGAFTITLPASPITGTMLVIKKIDSSANAVTVSGTIDGTASRTLTTQYTLFRIQYNGTNWDTI